MFCPKCGKRNDDGEILCSECGAKLKESSRLTVSFGASEPAEDPWIKIRHAEAERQAEAARQAAEAAKQAEAVRQAADAAKQAEAARYESGARQTSGDKGATNSQDAALRAKMEEQARQAQLRQKAQQAKLEEQARQAQLRQQAQKAKLEEQARQAQLRQQARSVSHTVNPQKAQPSVSTGQDERTQAAQELAGALKAAQAGNTAGPQNISAQKTFTQPQNTSAQKTFTQPQNTSAQQNFTQPQNTSAQQNFAQPQRFKSYTQDWHEAYDNGSGSVKYYADPNAPAGTSSGKPAASSKAAARVVLSLVVLLVILIIARVSKYINTSTFVLLDHMGIVDVSNDGGAYISWSDGHRLHDGSCVNTHDNAKAWCYINDDRAITLMENSHINIHKRKKDYWIDLNSGAIFFFVDEPLAQDENLQIQTDNMTIDIRSASGYIVYTDEGITELYVTSGNVRVISYDDSYNSDTGTVWAGCSAAVFGGDDETIYVSEINEWMLPIDAVLELYTHPEMMDAVTFDTDWDEESINDLALAYLSANAEENANNINMYLNDGNLILPPYLLMPEAYGNEGDETGTQQTDGYHSIVGTWRADVAESGAFNEYHFFDDGTGYVYVKGMYGRIDFTWDYEGNDDYGRVNIYDEYGRYANDDFSYGYGSMFVSGISYVRVSEDDVIEDTVETTSLDDVSLEWAGTWMAPGDDGYEDPVLVLGDDGRGQVIYEDGQIVTFTWSYEEYDVDYYYDGCILIHYVSISSDDYSIGCHEGQIDFSVFGLYEKR
ncbi:MAG: FecR domain-containing protein [Lachnospiraceae bacterium]|nr:FecR domain-containing protein [Lachnospiraceae bacterium]